MFCACPCIWRSSYKAYTRLSADRHCRHHNRAAICILYESRKAVNEVNSLKAAHGSSLKVTAPCFIGASWLTAGNPLYLPHETSALHSDISAYLRQSDPARLRGGQKTLYYFGRIRGNTCDNAAAMRYYIQAEKHITQNENLSISGRLLKFCNQTNNP